jgi:rhodanese-related sulfurtransferase
MDKRKIIQISFVSIVLISLAFGAIAQATAEETIVSVSPSTVEATHGDTFSIEIETDPAGAEIYGAQFDLYFDNNLLNATAQSQGTFLSQDGATTTVITNTVNSSIGKIEYGEAIMGAEHGVTEPGVLASITFDVVGTAGTCELKLSNVILSDLEAAAIDTTINGGTCTISTGASATASPTTATAATPTDISAEEAYLMLEEDAAAIVLLDVRGEAEYNAEHIADAEHIPLSELDGRIGELDADKKVIVYCQSGGRSRTASGKLVQQGHEQVYNMLGGISAWRLLYPTTLVKPAGTPTVAPSALISPSPGGASSAVVSPASTAPPSTIPVSTSTPLPEQKRDIPGFEAMSAIVMLLASYLILKQKGGKRE